MLALKSRATRAAFSCRLPYFFLPPLRDSVHPDSVSPPSAFLPPNFDSRKTVVLIAGQGLYPQLVAQSIRRAGVPLRLIAFDEETPPELLSTFPESERRTLLVGQLGKC